MFLVFFGMVSDTLINFENYLVEVLYVLQVNYTYIQLAKPTSSDLP